MDFTLVDYASLQLLLGEWRRRYLDPQWTAEPLEATFRDYVGVEQRRRQSPAWQRDRDWWLARLDALPGRPDLPLRVQPDTGPRASGTSTRASTRPPGRRSARAPANTA